MEKTITTQTIDIGSCPITIQIETRQLPEPFPPLSVVKINGGTFCVVAFEEVDDLISDLTDLIEQYDCGQ